MSALPIHHTPSTNDHDSAHDMWRNMLEAIPTLLGRLVTVASFRAGEADEYHHPNLDRVFAHGLAGRVLRESHEQLFAEWMGLFSDEQQAEADLYLSGLPAVEGPDLLLEASRRLVPASASEAVGKVFLVELTQVLRQPLPWADSIGPSSTTDASLELDACPSPLVESAVAG